MPRKNDIAKILAIGCAMLIVPGGRGQRATPVKLVFCVPVPGGWSLQRFKPLIDPRAKTEFAEMSLAGPLLLEFKLRRFSARSETAFDYKFDLDGRLNAVLGTVTVFGSWVGEANLFPNPDGTIPAYHVTYRSENQPAPKPDDAADYIGSLDAAPIYRTVQAVPCAAMLKEAEKMNATQK
jgi:hypothetical protein